MCGHAWAATGRRTFVECVLGEDQIERGVGEGKRSAHVGELAETATRLASRPDAPAQVRAALERRQRSPARCGE